LPKSKAKFKPIKINDLQKMPVPMKFIFKFLLLPRTKAFLCISLLFRTEKVLPEIARTTFCQEKFVGEHLTAL